MQQPLFLSDRNRQASTDSAWGKLETVPTRDAPTAVIANFPNPPATAPQSAAPASANSLSALQKDLLEHAQFVGQKLDHPAIPPNPDEASEQDAAAFASQIKAAALARQPDKDSG